MVLWGGSRGGCCGVEVDRVGCCGVEVEGVGCCGVEVEGGGSRGGCGLEVCVCVCGGGCCGLKVEGGVVVWKKRGVLWCGK